MNREPREEDPGLEMISRRPPKQKFANFEEYMAAHGGATAPIAGEGPLPELVPEFHLLSVPAENLVPGVRRRIDAAGNFAALPPGPQL